MKNTRSTIKLLLLSLSFAAIHFTASPMQWVMQPQERVTKEKQQAIQALLQRQIAASLAEQRKMEAGWIFSIPKANVIDFFAQNPAEDVLHALLNLHEYSYVTSAFQHFLNGTNEDTTRKHAYSCADTFALHGVGPALYQLTNFQAHCIAADRSLVTQNYLDNAASMALMGLVAIETASIWIDAYCGNKEFTHRVSAVKKDLKVTYIQALKTIIGQSDVNFTARWADTITVISDNMAFWIANNPLWLALMTIDRYQKIGFDAPTQSVVAEFNKVSQDDITTCLDQAVETINKAQSWEELFAQK